MQRQHTSSAQSPICDAQHQPIDVDKHYTEAHKSRAWDVRQVCVPDSVKPCPVGQACAAACVQADAAVSVCL